MCPAGTYQNTTGMDYCFDCPPGYYCAGGVEGDLTKLCPKGCYCPGNTTTAQPKCPPGTYNPSLGK